MSLIFKKKINDLMHIVEQKFGLFLSDWQFDTLKEAVENRMNKCNITNIDKYFELLMSTENNPDAEFKNLLNLITNNETFFFRIKEHYELLENEILPKIIKEKNDNQLTIWSAGCSTGEEIYSVAILIDNMGSIWQGWKINLLATDISERVLKYAQVGKYSKRSVQTIPQNLKEKYFKPENNGNIFVLSDKIKKMVKFGYYNLTSASSHNIVIPKVDIIFFRNVMIYFKEETIKKVMDNFHDILTDDGYLIIGPSESLWNITDKFKPVFYSKCFVYVKSISEIINSSKKIDEDENIKINNFNLPFSSNKLNIEEKKDFPVFENINTPIIQKNESNAFEIKEIKEISENIENYITEGLKKINLGLYDSALIDFNKYIEKNPNKIQGWLGKIVVEMNRSHYQEAIDYCLEYLQSNPFAAEINYILAIIYEASNQYDKSIEQYNKTLYINPKLVLARYKLANLYYKLNRFSDAAREYRIIMKSIHKKEISFFENQDFIANIDVNIIEFDTKRKLQKLENY